MRLGAGFCRENSGEIGENRAGKSSLSLSSTFPFYSCSWIWQGARRAPSKGVCSAHQKKVNGVQRCTPCIFNCAHSATQKGKNGVQLHFSSIPRRSRGYTACISARRAHVSTPCFLSSLMDCTVCSLARRAVPLLRQIQSRPAFSNSECSTYHGLGFMV